MILSKYNFHFSIANLQKQFIMIFYDNFLYIYKYEPLTLFERNSLFKFKSGLIIMTMAGFS